MTVARAAMLSVDLISGDVTVDLFSTDPGDPNAMIVDNPGLFASDLVASVSSDWPETRQFAIACDDAARRMMGDARTAALFGLPLTDDPVDR